METSLHELINYAFVVHMHPTVTNSLTCSNQAEEKTMELFGDEAMFIPYAPGYELFKKVQAAMVAYREKFGHDPNMIFLENHGVFVSADSTEEIRSIYDHITTGPLSRHPGKIPFTIWKSVTISPNSCLPSG